MPHGVHGTFEGTVAITLITTDEHGDIVEIPWAESCFDEKFPYGSIFVSALTTDEATGVETYYGSDSIAMPSTVSAANTFSVAVETDAVDEVYLMAVLDKWDDRYISPTDPRGYIGAPITVHEGDVAGGIEIEILTDYWCGWSGSGGGPCPDCPPGWSDGWGWIWDGTGYAEGSFDDLLAKHPSASVAVVAAKYRPDGDFPAVELEYQYDYQVWEPAALAGQSSLPFMLLGPSETTFYLWASCDLNDDGIINGPGETFAYYNDGPFTTGTTSQSGMDLTLEYW